MRSPIPRDSATPSISEGFSKSGTDSHPRISVRGWRTDSARRGPVRRRRELFLPLRRAGRLRGYSGHGARLCGLALEALAAQRGKETEARSIERAFVCFYGEFAAQSQACAAPDGRKRCRNCIFRNSQDFARAKRPPIYFRPFSAGSIDAVCPDML